MLPQLREVNGARIGEMASGIVSILSKTKPDLMLLIGDADTTLSGALASKIAHIPAAHVESGLRSGDDSHIEERNRIQIDKMTEIHFATEPSGLENIRNDATVSQKAYCVGSLTIDALYCLMDEILEEVKQSERISNYGVVTIHRQENIDNIYRLRRIVDFFNVVSKCARLIFIVHPRTRNSLVKNKLFMGEKISIVDPMLHAAAVGLMRKAQFVITDSGGIQEETTVLGVPCFTLRDSTERPITVHRGTNKLIEPDAEVFIERHLRAVASSLAVNQTEFQLQQPCDEWDGETARRIFDILLL